MARPRRQGQPNSELSFEEQLQRVNQRLRLAELGVQVEQRGQRLVLRGTLPPKPGSSRQGAAQQRLSLGVAANSLGLIQAERQAKVVAAALITGSFDWSNYQVWSGRSAVDPLSLQQQLRQFEQHFFDQPQRQVSPASSQTTWRGAYAPYLRKLEAIACSTPKLTLAEAICTTIESLPLGSRSRQTCCTALGALAAFLELELPKDLKTLAGSYTVRSLSPRDLPSDAIIVEQYQRIPHPGWQFVYGIMATYGLRNHEVFFADYSALERGEEPVIQILETTKTGEHEVWPFQPDWVDAFRLRQPCLPKVTTDLGQTTLQRVGQLVTRQFKRYGIPFAPYDLRHAWAVRTIHIGLPDTVAAKMMGHSVAIHNRTYHRWITRRDQQAAVDAALRR